MLSSADCLSCAVVMTVIHPSMCGVVGELLCCVISVPGAGVSWARGLLGVDTAGPVTDGGERLLGYCCSTALGMEVVPYTAMRVLQAVGRANLVGFAAMLLNFAERAWPSYETHYGQAGLALHCVTLCTDSVSSGFNTFLLVVAWPSHPTW